MERPSTHIGLNYWDEEGEVHSFSFYPGEKYWQNLRGIVRRIMRGYE